MSSPFDYGIGQGAPIPANSSWQAPGQPQQNIPLDPAKGQYQGLGPAAVSFWGAAPNALDPSNAQISEWDQVSFANQVMPGLALVTTKRIQKLDPKPVRGQDFATITLQGIAPAEVKVQLRLWTPQHLSAWTSVLPILMSPSKVLPNGTIQALEIYHPALAIMNINAVLIRSVSALKPSPIRDMWETDIECLEYKPVNKQKDRTATAKGSLNITIKGVSVPSQAQGQPPASFPSSAPGYTGPQGALSR